MDIRCEFCFPQSFTIEKANNVSTSPSFYLEMVGTASVRDSCGQVGSIYTNAIVAVPSDGLSTISLDLPIGASFINRNYGRETIASYTKQVRLKDLACPTWGLMNADNLTSQQFATVGSPFFPIIHPPSELNSFDHAWRSCTEFVTAEIQGGFLPYEIFDPPRMLVPASALAPAENPVHVVTSLDPNPTAGSPPKANPADLRTPELPSITNNPHSSDPGQRSTIAVERTSAGEAKPAPTANSKNSDPKESKHGPGQIPSGVDHDPVDPGSTSESTGNHNLQPSPGIGALIFSAFGAPWAPSPSVKSSGGGRVASSALDRPSMDMTKPGDNPIGGIETLKVDTGENGYFTFAGQAFTTHLSDVFVAGSKVIPNGIGVTRSGTIINLDSDGNLVVDSSTVKIANFGPTPPPSTYTMNGQIFQGDPSFLVVDGKTMKPGGSGITVSGTLLRLNSGGELIVDTSTLKFASFLPTPPPSVYTVNGQILTGNPSFLAVGGKTITPGGAAVTISGTPLKLNSGGEVVVGTSTLELASFPAMPLPSVYTANGQKFTGDPSFLAIGGKTMIPGGAAVSISGTLLRLNPGGEIVVGTSTLELASFLLTPVPSVYTVNGQKFTGNPSFLAIGGKTMTAGGAAVTISGTPVFLEPSGTLRFGNKEIPFETNGSSRVGNGNVAPATFLGGQERVQVIKQKIMWLGLWITGGLYYLAVL